MKLQFNSDAYYNRKLKYEKGSVHEISNEFGEADRWIKRGVAEEAKIEKKEEIKVKPETPKPTKKDKKVEEVVEPQVKEDNKEENL